MITKNIFEETGKIGYEINKLQSELEKLSIKCTEIMAICPHEIVFKYTDDHPRKTATDGSYFCPACGKTIRCYHKEQLSETPFTATLPSSNCFTNLRTFNESFLPVLSL